jgi:hypothetical protein
VTVIVGVHGIAQQQVGRQQLRDPWARALADGLERAAGHRCEVPDLEIAYYGDVFVAHAGSDGKAATGDRASEDAFAGADGDEVEFVLAAACEVLTPAELAEVDAQPDKFPGVPTPLLRVVAAIDRRVGHRAGALFIGELRQARIYLTDPLVKAQVDVRVAEAVTAQCRVVIGHSLGSVVALEHLRLHPQGHRLDLLLTLGSPLGMRAIRHLLADPGFGADSEGPPGVRRWVNLRDPRDPIALAGGLARWWPAVEDDSSIDNGLRNAHAAQRYLSKRQTGAAALAAIPDLAARP